ncbi:hypothetical protein HHI36_008302 [Cryptolaemus montrouzieri]|uniref:Uncharacterized protein n=1 Tax=Cryptolaemus montrouzieri TaxID=559131 RepID=A0ABD2MS51_9CUCU
MKTYGGIERKKLQAKQPIYVRDYRNPHKEQWVHATITKQIGKSTYMCRIVEGNSLERHLNQIKERMEMDRGGGNTNRLAGTHSEALNASSKIGYFSKTVSDTNIYSPTIIPCRKPTY